MFLKDYSEQPCICKLKARGVPYTHLGGGSLDFNPQGSSVSMEFWELRSTPHEEAKVEKHGPLRQRRGQRCHKRHSFSQFWNVKVEFTKIWGQSTADKKENKDTKAINPCPSNGAS